LKLSIITVCYNDASALNRTINSIQDQGYELEHVVIDGGSTDGTVELLKSAQLRCKNLTYLSEPDKGVYDAINKGIGLATGEYILVLNAGDTFGSNDVIKAIFSSRYYSNQYYLVCRVSYLYKTGKVKSDNPNFSSNKYLECSHQAFIYKKSLHNIIGIYTLLYKSASDYDFFSKVYKKYGLLQTEKYPFIIAIREKFGSDMSDSMQHTVEMIKIDYKHNRLRETLVKRTKEFFIKLIKAVAARQ
jgi:glycosyltransferase involved in cell wall biosynthesis